MYFGEFVIPTKKLNINLDQHIYSHITFYTLIPRLAYQKAKENTRKTTTEEDTYYVVSFNKHPVTEKNTHQQISCLCHKCECVFILCLEKKESYIVEDALM